MLEGGDDKLLKLYRYEEHVTGYADEEGYGSKTHSSTLHVGPRIYLVTRETAKGWWIHDGCDEKWVSKTSKRRFAYPTKAEALHNYKARKLRQIKILKAQLDRAETGLKIADTVDVDATDREFVQGMLWG
jgi:hypothetical protein